MRLKVEVSVCVCFSVNINYDNVVVIARNLGILECESFAVIFFRRKRDDVCVNRIEEIVTCRRQCVLLDDGEDVVDISFSRSHK